MPLNWTAQHHAALRVLLTEPQITPRAIQHLRQRFDEQTARRLLSIAELQPKARRKFGDGVWWVTHRGLQQATAWRVGDRKASWFGDQTVVDLCCGVGGDLVRLARRGAVIGVDADEEIAALAAVNLRQAIELQRSSDLSTAQHLATADRYPRCEVITGDALQVSRPAGAAIHIDPDRRSARGGSGIGGRTTTADHFQPAWDEVVPVLERSGDAIAKLAPATALHGPLLDRVHRCWIALGNSVREQSVLFGRTMDRARVTAGTRSAMMLGADGQAEHFAPEHGEDDSADGFALSCDRRTGLADGTTLVDPHAAIRAAGLTTSFARRYRLRMIGGPSGFLCGFLATTEACAFGRLATAERMLWWGGSDDRGLRRELRRLDARPATVKTRGVDLDPAVLVKRYRRCGQQPVTLWLGRDSEGVYAAITTPRESPSRAPSAGRDNPTDPKFPATVPPPRP